MTEQAKVPAIRFAGFTDPWEQRKLGELALTYSGGTPSAGNSAYYGGEIPFIRSAEIDCDSTELSLTVAGLNNSSAKLVDKGMVLYAMYGATSGEVAISKIKGAINQAILAMDASDMAANRFIAYWLRRQKKSITETFLQGGQGNLSGAIIKELGIPQPSLDEQRQIGSFFSNLDDLITLHQRKYDKLVIFKKSMLEKMFPKDGESVPEIRFAGFTDPWEQRKFSNLTDRVSMQSSDPDLPQVEYEDIVSDEGTLNKDLRDKEGGKTGIKFYAGDVLYGKLRPYLMNWLYPQFNGVAVGDFWVLRATECDSSFLYRLVQTDSFQRLANVSSGSKMPRADWNLISQSFFAVLADYAEQRVIAKSLAELDDLITLHQRKLELLQNIKKSLLDKMFV